MGRWDEDIPDPADVRRTDCVRKLPSKKRNTKRWCRGVHGREHDYNKEFKVWAIQIPGCRKGYWHWKCSKCGRQEWRDPKDSGSPTVSDALRAKLDREGK